MMTDVRAVEFDPKNIPDGNDPLNPIKIYTDGIFDCFHFGHARLLEQCKKMFKHVHLVIGVCSDEDTTKSKGKPVMTTEERCECVRHCRWVDEVYHGGPWVPDLAFLDKIKCHYIAHDPEPYAFQGCSDVYEQFKSTGRFLATKRTEGISTTDIIMRILRDYDVYIERSIKKGSSATDLNISKQKYFALKIKIFVEKVEYRYKFFPLKSYFKKWKGIS
jgi:choline-phosphate cytidylyltransferase